VIFIIVYVGAIAVLFLFVLMMLNIKNAELQENYQNSLTIMFFFALFFIIEFLFLFRTEFYSLDILNSSSVMFLSEFLQNSLLTQDFNNF
jgi:NADH:ubiquinone oxidoreductase subunit 6 (subunit J)